MTTQLKQADLLFLIQQLLPASQGVVGGPDPFSLLGLRTVDGTANNLTNLMIVDQYGNSVHTNTFANANQPFFNVSTSPITVPTVNPTYTTGVGAAGDVTDASPRIISNLVVDMSAANPSLPADVIGNPSTDGILAPTNAFFTFFGQFFDHGLDFIDKGGMGTVSITILPNDPFLPAGVIPLTRATLRDPNTGLLDANGVTNSSSAPLVEQSQTYGQLETTAPYLMEYSALGVATGRLVTHTDPVTGVESMATWADIKANALLGLGVTLTDEHILNLPDPADGVTLTGQAFANDLAHNANPSGGLTPDLDGDVNNIFAPRPAGTYDDELLDAHKIAGDARANENVVLTSIHQAFHSEHNRIALMLQDLNAQQILVNPLAVVLAGDDLFNAAKLINEMQYQHFAFEEFARRLSPNIDAFADYEVAINPNVSAEFSQAIYRLGHSMLTDSVQAVNAAGQIDEQTLVTAFLNPVEFDDVGAGAFVEGQTRQQHNLIDEHIVTSLRNFLVGLPLDLAAINIARGRDVGLPTLNQLREQLLNDTGEGTLAPYTSWTDFGAHMLHPGSLVNFIAAYARDATVAAARNAGDNEEARRLAQVAIDDGTFEGGGALSADLGFWDIDLWLGALAEEKALGPGGVVGLLGTTADFIFATQLRSLQDGDRLYYLARLGGTNILDEIEASRFGDLFERGTGARHTNGDIFGTADEYVELSALNTNTFTSPAGNWMEVIGGTTLADTIIAGAGNDTLWGEDGDDTLNGGDGNDDINGGDGDDTIHGGAGDDFIRGNAGADTIHGDAGVDHIFGGAGNDVIDAGDGVDEVFGGFGDDEIDGGAQDDGIFGQEGDDVIRGGAGSDVLDGGSQNDHLSGGGAGDTLISGSGYNVLVGGPGADVLDGTFGDYDLASYADSSVGLTIDLAGVLSTGDAMGDTYLGIEEVGGTPFIDQILGDAGDNTLSGRGGGSAFFGEVNAANDLVGDTLDGGAGNDVLYDNPGLGDTLIGGAGVDQAVFLGRVSTDFTDPFGSIGTTGNGTLVETATGAENTLLSIQELAFDDGIWSTVTGVGWLPLLGVVESSPLSVNGVSLDPNFTNDIQLNDGAPIPAGFSPGILVGTIEVFDRDNFNGPVNPIVLGGPDAAQFQIRNPENPIGPATPPFQDTVLADGSPGQDGIFDLFTQQIYFVGVVPGAANAFVNYEVQQTYNITLAHNDIDGGSGINFTVEVTDTNDNAPLFTSPDQVSVWNTTAVTDVVYRATATDVDTVSTAVNGNLDYTLDTSPPAGSDNALFVMTNNGEVKFDTVNPGNGVYLLDLLVDDGVTTPTAKRVEIRVTDVNAPLVFVGGNQIVAENTPAATVILDVDATDPDDPFMIMPVTYELDPMVGDNSLFTIDAMTGELRFIASPDFENPQDMGGNNVYDVTITGFHGVGSSTHNVTVEVTDETIGVVINGTAGNDVVLPNFTTLIVPPTLPTTENDTIFGMAGIDVLDGGAGDDTIFGGAGADVLLGGTGNDTLEGGEGNDTVNGGSGIDTVVFNGQLSGFTPTALNDDGSIVYTDRTFDDGNEGSDTLSDIEFITLSLGGIWEVNLGTTGGDLLTSSEVHWDIMNGGAGNDTLMGGNNPNILGGGSGNDIIIGGTGSSDTAMFNGHFLGFAVTAFNDDGSIVYTDINLADGNEGSDTLSFIEAIDPLQGGMWEVSLGTAGSDLLTSSKPQWDIMNGGAGDDTLIGAAGNDILGGGSGNDMITGAGGADTFVFDSALSAATNVDTITDFAVGSDLIRLDSAIFTTLSPGALSTAEFFADPVATAAGDATDRIVYNSTSGALFYDDDGVGGNASQQFATLGTGLALTEASFVIV